MQMNPQTQQRYDKAMALVAEGMSYTNAAKKVKMATSYFSHLRKGMGVTAGRAPQIIDAAQTRKSPVKKQPVKSTAKVVVIQGSLAEMRELLGGVFNG